MRWAEAGEVFKALLCLLTAAAVVVVAESQYPIEFIMKNVT